MFRYFKGCCLALALVIGLFSLGGQSAPRKLHNAAAVSYSTPLLDPFGAAQALPPPSAAPNSLIVDAAVVNGGTGALYVTATGQVFATGTAQSYGSASSIDLYAPIVGIAVTPDQRGYWLVASDGGVFCFGDAQYYGSMGGVKLNGPIVAMAPTRDGKGYWMVATDGGIFSFGDAQFYGSMGGQHLNAAVVSMAPTQSGQGYWLVASDGGIFSFGDAPFYGSLGNLTLNAPIMGMAETQSGDGYYLVGNDGGVFTFGDASFHGSLGGLVPNVPVSAIVTNPSVGGYWLLSADAISYNFTPTPSERTLSASAAIATAAESQIGPATQGGFCNPYGPCEEWCALFASYTWNAGGIPSVSDGFTGDLYNWAATHTSVIGPNVPPAEGDIVFYGTGPQDTGTSIHAGVVIQTWPDGSLITIEGDSGPGPAGWLGVTINGPYLASRSEEANGMPIYGFGEPT